MIFKIVNEQTLGKYLEHITGMICRYFLMSHWRIAYREEGIREYLRKVLTFKDGVIILDNVSGKITSIAIGYPIRYFSEIHHETLAFSEAMYFEPFVVNFDIGVIDPLADLLEEVERSAKDYERIVILDAPEFFTLPMFLANGFEEKGEKILKVPMRTEIGVRRVPSVRIILVKDLIN
ncbi:MAG: hypothetical protein Q7T50_00645 [Candidatus Magasanikbacteria bacterium]|nr:hypothetical protein [Candidatus Magasanikbacteria bacterium]